MRIAFRDKHGHRIVGILTGVKRGQPAVVILHGLTSQKGRYRPWASALRAKDIGSLRFDLYGHGESDGTLATMTPSELLANAEAAIRELEKLGAAPIGLAGGSLGGMVSLLAAAKNKDIRALVLFAPASKFPWWGGKNDPCSRAGQGDSRCTHAHRFLNRSFVRDARRIKVTARNRSVRQPMLIFHGTRDESIPLAHSRALAKATGARLVILPGIGHALRQQPRSVQHRVFREQADFFFHQFFDDEPLSAAEKKALRESLADFRAGRTISHAELKKKLDLS